MHTSCAYVHDPSLACLLNELKHRSSCLPACKQFGSFASPIYIWIYCSNTLKLSSKQQVNIATSWTLENHLFCFLSHNYHKKCEGRKRQNKRNYLRCYFKMNQVQLDPPFKGTCLDHAAMTWKLLLKRMAINKRMQWTREARRPIFLRAWVNW